VAYVAYFLRSVDKKQPPYDQVKADVLRLLSQSETCLKDGRFSQEDFNLARFAICAWVDEAVLSSPWQEKSSWQKEQLQRLFYQTTEAGEGFFERLNNLGPHQREVREVYYLCLAMGFKGRYVHEGDDFLLDQLKTSNLKFLMGTSLGLPSLDRDDLFPEAYPTAAEEMGAEQRKFHFSGVTLACLLGPVVLFGLLFLIYRFVLDGVSASFMQAVPK
jgi:type VI secretion system protein ImpK